MIRINLLPHREEKRKARRQQFYALLGLVSALAAVVWFSGYTVINGYLNAQDDKNAFLSKEIAALDKDIQEIKKLKEQTDALLARKQVIESLQANRAETVHLFNELARQVPSGIYLRTVKQSNEKIKLTGYAQSAAKVSTLMRNLDGSPLLEKPELIEIKAATVDKRSLAEFALTVQFTRQTGTDDKGGSGKSNQPAKGRAS